MADRSILRSAQPGPIEAGNRAEATLPDLGHSTDAPVNFRVEQGHAFAGGVVEVRRYFWTTPLRQTVDALSHALVLNMALTSRPIHTRVDRMNDQGDPLAGEAGRLLVMIPGVPYRLSAPSGALRSLHCAIDCERLEAMVGAPIDWQMLASFSGNLRDGAAIESCMTRIHDELVSNRIGRETAIEACIDLICVELARQFRHGRPAKPDVMRGGLAAWRMPVGDSGTSSWPWSRCSAFHAVSP